MSAAAQEPAPDEPPTRPPRSSRSLAPYLHYQPAMPIADPPSRILFGSFVVLAAWWGWRDETVGRISYWMVLIACFGTGMIVSGIREQRHDARIAADLSRAAREWPQLLDAADGERRAGRNLPGFLARRGYRSFWVRRHLAARLERELQRPAETGGAEHRGVPQS